MATTTDVHRPPNRRVSLADLCRRAARGDRDAEQMLEALDDDGRI